MSSTEQTIPFATMKAVNAGLTLRAGRLHCDKCERSFHKLEALRDHALMLHAGDYSEALGKLVKQERRERLAETRRAEASARQSAAERKARLVTFAADEVDEIAGTLEMLIGFMEPYYAGTNAADEPEALIKRLRALADGRTTA
jgi:hypothetical protein